MMTPSMRRAPPPMMNTPSHRSAPTLIPSSERASKADRRVLNCQCRIRAFDECWQNDVKKLEGWTKQAARTSELRRLEARLPWTETKQKLPLTNSAIALLATPLAPYDPENPHATHADKRRALAELSKDCVRRDELARRQMIAGREEKLRQQREASLAALRRERETRVQAKKEQEEAELERLSALDIKRRVTDRNAQLAAKSADRAYLAEEQRKSRERLDALKRARLSKREADMQAKEEAAKEEAAAKETEPSHPHPHPRSPAFTPYLHPQPSPLTFTLTLTLALTVPQARRRQSRRQRLPEQR